jgi:hypothetical protein
MGWWRIILGHISLGTMLLLQILLFNIYTTYTIDIRISFGKNHEYLGSVWESSTLIILAPLLQLHYGAALA